MSLSILQMIAVGLFGLGILLSTLRMIKGPTAPDRVVASDTLAVITTAGLAFIASLFDNPIYLDIALVYGTLAFVGTVAISRALEGDSQ
jgi:multisubunit Na+/H+ antiporter MnhF subunit